MNDLNGARAVCVFAAAGIAGIIASNVNHLWSHSDRLGVGAAGIVLFSLVALTPWKTQ